MKFKENNNITAYQDRNTAYCPNIPHDIEFSMKKMSTYWQLCGKGYGDKEDYGNGPLYILLKESNKDTTWAEIDEIAPTDDELYRLANVFHAPNEWLQE